MNDITVIGTTEDESTVVSLPSNALETINAQQHTNPLDEQHAAADSIQGFSKAVEGRDETLICKKPVLGEHVNVKLPNGRVGEKARRQLVIPLT